MVEEAFRACKTGHLELRPIYVRKPRRTRGHVFVVMLSYLLVRELREVWRELDSTVEENLKLLSSLSGVRMKVQGNEVSMIPNPRSELRRLFELAGVAAPQILPRQSGNVDTERKLPSRRKSR
jgi:transposase